MLAPVRSLADIDWTRWRGVPTTLVFVVRGGEVLLMRKKRGLGAGKINGPGGKLDPGETPLAGAIRETREEVCVTPRAMRWAGRNRFQFTDGGAIDVQVFRASDCEGCPRPTPEADPFWTRSGFLTCWPGARSRGATCSTAITCSTGRWS
jgi:8-oxo-dGTP diphosphatase